MRGFSRSLAAALAVLMLASVPAPAGDGFEVRGVIEGFYGPPWPKASRLGFLQWMADHGMNLYVHAPKNDPYQRLQWRSPYPGEEMEQFAQEIALVEPQGLSWAPSISPGFPLIEAAQEHDEDICFSCADDFGVLVAKLDPFWNAGARTLMLSFDDVIKISTHPEDALAYGVGDYAYGVMNGDLLNRLWAHYDARTGPGETFRLITVPADYFGVSTTPYLEGLRSILRDEVIVMWTGVLVVSPTITCLEADGYARAIGRRPLLWDNFPVNDYAPYKLMVGPYAGRAADLDECLLGILSNPANQVKANEIPLYTVADYLSDPAGYEKEASWDAALQEVAGADRDLLGRFVENVRSTALDRTEAVRFTSLRDGFLASLATMDWPAAHEALVAELDAERAAPAAIRASLDPQLVHELECELPFQAATETCTGSWLARLAFNAGNGLETTAALAATRPDVEAALSGGTLAGRVRAPANAEAVAANAETLAAMITRDDGNPFDVHGDRVYFALGPLYAAENRMDEYFALALGRVLAYAPTAPLASSSVTLTVNGAVVPVAADGTFSVAVAATSAEAIVTDGAGNHTRRVFSVP